MRKSVRAASPLPAGVLTAGLTAINAGPAHAADPTTMTSGFYAYPGNSALRRANANPGDGWAAAIRTSIANTPAVVVLEPAARSRELHDGRSDRRA
jgi:endoglucanase